MKRKGTIENLSNRAHQSMTKYMRSSLRKSNTGTNIVPAKRWAFLAVTKRCTSVPYRADTPLEEASMSHIQHGLIIFGGSPLVTRKPFLLLVRPREVFVSFSTCSRIYVESCSRKFPIVPEIIRTLAHSLWPRASSQTCRDNLFLLTRTPKKRTAQSQNTDGTGHTHKKKTTGERIHPFSSSNIPTWRW